MSDRFPTPHAEHDLVLIAAAVGADASGTEAVAAERLIADCADCAELAADLRAIARATAALPAPARARDYTLRPEQAARLRPRGWRRLAAAFGPARLDLARPLAAGLTTLGLAGLLLSALPLVQSNGASGAPVAAPAFPASGGEKSTSQGAEGVALSPVGSTAPVPAASAASGPAATTATDTTGEVPRSPAGNLFGGQRDSASSAPSAAPMDNQAVSTPAPAPRVTSNQAPPAATPAGFDVSLAAASAACLLLGVSLFLLRRGAGRRSEAG